MKTLASIEEQIAKLQAEADVFRKRERDDVIERIREAMVVYSISMDEIIMPVKTRKGKAAAKKAGRVLVAARARDLNDLPEPFPHLNKIVEKAGKKKVVPKKATRARREEKAAPPPKPAAKKAAKTKTSSAPGKYKEGAIYTDGTRMWRGHGRVPNWLMDHAEGRPLSEFELPAVEGPQPNGHDGGGEARP